MAKLISTNPANNYEMLGSVLISSDKEIEEKVKLANSVKSIWRELGLKKRIKLLKPIFQEFKDRETEIAELITKEMWKPINESLSEVSWYIEDFDWFVENVKKAIKDEITYESKDSIHKIVYEPTWTVAVISPWNYPFGMFVWWIVPNLLVWNTVVFKISEECPLVWKLIEEVFNKYKLPKGVFNEVYWAWDVGEKLARSDINLIWFTWSSKVWQNLYKIAAEKFIKVILEMWGSNPCIVFDDVDIKKAVEIIYNKRFKNCWQICTAVKRLIVHESIFDEVVTELKKLLEKKKQGNPLEKDTDIWSLVALRQVKLLEEQLNDAIEKNVKVITWWKIPKNLNWAYFEPTLLINITKDMNVWKEEVFWPILPVVKFKTEEEAIEMANDTIYGLWAKIITRDLEKAERVALKIEWGGIEINNATRWESCNNPFWWYKKSGMWREHWVIWFRELCQIKTISMNKNKKK